MYRIINRKKLVATFVADLLGRLIFFPRLLFRRSSDIEATQVKRILVIRSAYIGDVVMTLPLLKPLRDRFPDAHITFLVAPGAETLLENNPFVDEVLQFGPFWFYPTSPKDYRSFIKKLRGRTYDLVIEARGDIREILGLVFPLKSRFKVSYGVGGGSFLLTHLVPHPRIKHRVDYHLDIARFLGCECGEPEWSVYLRPEEIEQAADLLLEHGVSTPFIALHPGSRLPLKRLGADKWAAACDALIEKYRCPLVLLGAPNERGLAEEITSVMKQQTVTLVGQISIRQMAAIMAKAQAVLCNDSAPMHIAAAMKAPTVAVFGPSKSAETGPYGVPCVVVEKDFPCRYTCDESRCRHETYNACMEAVRPEDVVGAVASLWT